MPRTLTTLAAARCRMRFARGLLAVLFVFAISTSAWAVDVRQVEVQDLALRQQREWAIRNLQQARGDVERARQAAAAARRRLDEFLSGHFSEQREVPRETVVETEDTETVLKMLPGREQQRLQSQLQDLTLRRQELLGYLKEAHPEVVEVDRRIELVRDRLSRFEKETQSAPAPRSRSAQELADFLNRDRFARQQAGDRYAQLYEEWQTAERAVDLALAAETAAIGQLETLDQTPPAVVDAPAPMPPVATEPAAAPPALPLAPAPAPAPLKAEPQSAARGGRSNSQPLALAALLIALAVAAFAAVRLARSTADPIFASADEVAAALALPVVGIIPRTAFKPRRMMNRRKSTRRAIVAAQIALAVAVFALVAMFVQNPAGILRLFTR